MKDNSEHMFDVNDVSCVRKDRVGPDGGSDTWYFIYVWVSGIKYELSYLMDKVKRDADYAKLMSAKQY